MFGPNLPSRRSNVAVRFWLVVVSAMLAGANGGLLPRVASAADPRDWTEFPAIYEHHLPKDAIVYAVGDAHGDYTRLVDLLRNEHIISAKSSDPKDLDTVRWMGSSLLICTGDMIDYKSKKEPDYPLDHSIEVIQLFIHLQNQVVGKKLIAMAGNHEAEFLANPENDKAKSLVWNLRQRGIDPLKVADGTDSLGLGKFIRSLPFAVRIDDWFFAHAGNPNSGNLDVETRPRSLADLRSFLQDGVTKDGFRSQALLASDSILEAKLDNPWWEKQGESGEVSRARLQKWVTALGTDSDPVNHLVIGHQPGKVNFNGEELRTKGTLVSRFRGSLFLIDAGMSGGVDYSTGSLLKILLEDSDVSSISSISFTPAGSRKEELLMGR